MQLLLLVSLSSCGQSRGPETKKQAAMENEKTTIGIIGSGNVGGTLGKKWAKAGYKILFSSRHPEELSGLVKAAPIHRRFP